MHTIFAMVSFGQDMSSSVIGEEELHEARKKHLQGYTDSSVDLEENPRKIPRIEELAAPSGSVVSSEGFNSLRIDSSIQDTQSFSNKFGVPSEQKQSGTPF